MELRSHLSFIEVPIKYPENRALELVMSHIWHLISQYAYVNPLAFSDHGGFLSYSCGKFTKEMENR